MLAGLHGFAGDGLLQLAILASLAGIPLYVACDGSIVVITVASFSCSSFTSCLSSSWKKWKKISNDKTINSGINLEKTDPSEIEKTRII